MSENWVTRKRPARLEARFDFSNYEETRSFLDRAAEMYERESYFPDMSFGRTHVSITLQSQDETAAEAEEVSEEIWRYARLLDDLVTVEKPKANDELRIVK